MSDKYFTDDLQLEHGLFGWSWPVYDSEGELVAECCTQALAMLLVEALNSTAEKGCKDCLLVTDEHTCPFAEEIHDDSETLCSCCEDCTNQCAWDI